MKKTIAMLLVLLMTGSAMAQNDKQIVILHSNDTHSCIYPLNVNLADTALAGRGGYLRRAAFVEQQRKQYPNLLLIDSGDFSQGSPYYTLNKGEVEVGLMNIMRYDAATIGNHEFDFGLENMARIFRMANFPILCSNYDFTGTPVEGTVKPWTIIKRDGVKIGLFALDPKLIGLVDTAKCQGVKYLDPVAKANEMAALLKAKKCDLVICVSHLGWDKVDMNDQIMIAGSRGIDLVLGGHSHTYMKQLEYVKDLDGKMVPVDQNGKHGLWIGKMLLNMKKKK
ncbi:MAG: metallophosphatase [Prevotella sp.]|nr:metallophosphatase [Prevotella sp.]MBQ2060750.1 metallophosphatase [Prevotella sp.]